MQSLPSIDESLTPVVITQLEKIHNDIALARTMDAAVSFDYRDPKGNKLARSHVASLRSINGDIDRAHKAAKAGVLEIGRKIDAKKDELKGEVAALIDPHQREIDAIEKEEADRKAAAQRVIDSLATVTSTASSDGIRGEIERLHGISGEGLREFAAEFQRRKAANLEALAVALNQAIQREAEAAELARLRKEAAEAAERARVERIQREAVEAERKRVEDAERQRLADEAVAREREATAARDAIAAAHRREQDAIIAAERAAREKAEAEARAAAAEAQRLKDAEERRLADLARAAAEEARKKAESDWIAKEAADRAAAEAARAKAAQENRERVASAIRNALAGMHADDIAAQIVAGKVPHVRVDWEVA